MDCVANKIDNLGLSEWKTERETERLGNVVW